MQVFFLWSCFILASLDIAWDSSLSSCHREKHKQNKLNPIPNYRFEAGNLDFGIKVSNNEQQT
jgi:hypothetical protein